MALFTGFTGNVVDNLEQPITAFRYRGYHVPTKTWSEWYSSKNESQYNFNLGDNSWLTQDGIANKNDSILIVMETLEAKPIDRSFAMVTLKLTEETLYVNNIQLLPCMKPNVVGLWELSSPTDGVNLFNNEVRPAYKIYTGRVGEVISVVQTFNDEHSWKYNGLTHYHLPKYLEMNIFEDRLGIASAMYDWASGTYVTDNKHIFEYVSSKQINGYYVIKTKVRNLAGLMSYDVVYIKIKNVKPILTYSWNPINPTIKDLFEITGTIVDDTNALIKVTHTFDDVLITSNVKREYIWEQSLGLRYRKDHLIKGTVIWSDGFSSQSYTVEYHIVMTNIPPVFILTEQESDIVGNILLLCNELEDADGETGNVRLRWELYFKTPLDNEFKQILSTTYPVKPNERYLEVTLNTVGNYKAICYAIDEADGESSQTVEFTIEEEDNAVANDNQVEWE